MEVTNITSVAFSLRRVAGCFRRVTRISVLAVGFACPVDLVRVCGAVCALYICVCIYIYIYIRFRFAVVALLGSFLAMGTLFAMLVSFS